MIKTFTEEEQEAREAVTDYGQCVQDETTVFSKSTQKLKRNSKILIKTRSMCQTFVKEYESQENARVEEINLIKALQQMVFIRQHKLAQMQDFDIDIDNQSIEDYMNVTGYQEKAQQFDAEEIVESASD